MGYCERCFCCCDQSNDIVIYHDRSRSTTVAEQPYSRQPRRVSPLPSPSPPLLPPSQTRKAVKRFSVGILNGNILRNAREFVDTITPTINEILRILESIDPSKVRKVSEIRTCNRDVKDTVEAAFKLIDAVDDLYYYGKDESEMEKITNALRRNNLGPLREFQAKNDSRLANIGALYREFIDACNRAESSTCNAEWECRRRQREACSRKNTARAVGGATTAGIAAAGIAASVISGILTAGLSLLVTVPVTVGATTAAAATTHYVAEEFASEERSFKNLCAKFSSLTNAALRLHESVDELHYSLQSFRELEYHEVSLSSQEQQCIVTMLTTYARDCSESRGTSAHFRSTVQKLKTRAANL